MAMTIQTTTPAPVSSAYISGQLDALAATLERLEREAADLSFAAVSGNKDAAKALSELNTRIAGAHADRTVLERARLTALNLEDAAARDAAETERKRHYAIARDLAGKLLGLSERTDALIAEFGALISDMNATERAIWSELHRAKAAPPDSGVGRNNIAGTAFANMNNATAAGDFKSKKSVADWVLAGWGFLLTREAADDL